MYRTAILINNVKDICNNSILQSFEVSYSHPHLRKLILCPAIGLYMPDEVMQTVLPPLRVKLESNLIVFLLKETHIT